MAGIGDLVANLSVNSAPWTKGLRTARTQMSSFAGGVSSLIAPVAASLAGVWGTSASISAYSDSIAAQRKLQAVLDATGGAAGLTSQEIADYASELQSVTNFEDDATVAAAGVLAAFTNIRGDVFKSAIASAQDLTAVMGGDLEGNIKLIGKALNDPIDGLAKLNKAGVQFTADQENQIKALQHSGDILGAQGIILDGLTSKFGGAAKATADPVKQLANTIGDVAEGIGSLLLPAISVGAAAISDLLGVVSGGGDTFKAMGIEAAVQLSHVGSYLVLAATQWELWFVQIGEGASHLFTTTIPAYVTWLSDNGINIVQTFAANTLTVFENLGANIGSAMQEIWNYISTGGTDAMEIAWTPLTKGFINTINELPDIPDRVVGEFEQSLIDSIEAQSDGIAASMAEQRKKLEEQFSPLKKVPAPVTGDLTDFSDPEKEKNVKEAKRSDNKAALQGSQEAASIVLRGVAGTGSSAERIAKDQLKELKKLNANMKSKPPEIAVAGVE